MQVDNVSDSNIELIRNFIKRVPTIKEIDEDVLKNIVMLYDNEGIKGIISYETYMDKGLIRYFIFQKDVSFKDLKQLFKTMLENAKKENIKTLLSVVDQKELMNFFNNLGFVPYSVDDIYIDETSLGETVYKKAQGMLYYID